MKSDYIFTVVFILIVSVVFTLVLAVTGSVLAPQIAANRATAHQKAILEVFGQDTSGDAAAIGVRYGQWIRVFDADGKPAEADPSAAPGTDAANTAVRSTYVWVDEAGQPKGYAIPFEGPGLWGTIRGFLGVSPDLRQTTGIVFTEQNETPGLGGRIEEPAYKNQFQGLSIDPGTRIVYGDNAGKQLDAITGATQTSNSVLNILNKLLETTIAQMGGKSSG